MEASLLSLVFGKKNVISKDSCWQQALHVKFSLLSDSHSCFSVFTRP